MSQPLRALYSPFQRKNPKFFVEFSVIWSLNEGKHPPRAAGRPRYDVCHSIFQGKRCCRSSSYKQTRTHAMERGRRCRGGLFGGKMGSVSAWLWLLESTLTLTTAGDEGSPGAGVWPLRIVGRALLGTPTAFPWWLIGHRHLCHPCSGPEWQPSVSCKNGESSLLEWQKN